MTDKRGCTIREDLERIRPASEHYGRNGSVNFSGRYEVPALQIAAQLVDEGRIGKKVQTMGVDPHRQNIPGTDDCIESRKHVDAVGG